MPLAANTRNTWTYNNITLSPEQVAQVLWQAGLHDTNAIAQLIPIAARESGGRAGVQGTTQQKGAVSGDMGLFQINWGAHGQNLLNAGVIQSPQDLYDPVKNAQAAVYLSGGGNPQRMLQLWGVRNGTWAGTGGTLPAPNYGVVQNAQRGGLLGQPYAGGSSGGAGGAGVPPGYGSAAGVPPPGVSTAYYDMLTGQIDRQLALDTALTQGAVDYAGQQQGFANQLMGYQRAGLDLQGQRQDLENKYQNDLALLNQGLSEKQIATNEAEYRAIATNLAELRQLNEAGKNQDHDFYMKSVKLQGDIHDAAQAWIGKQQGFNERDYNLATEALKNVLTTEAARWAEIQRVSGAETDLATQKQQFITQGAQETYGQALAESQFVEKEQVRQARSEAIAKGARTSRGHGEDIASFAEQRGLAGSAATITRDDVLRMSQNQLAGELEQINQAYNQGQISYQDAQRQTANAQMRATLTFEQNAGQLGYQSQQAGFDYWGRRGEIDQQWNNAYHDFLRNVSNSDQQQTAARLQYEQQYANLLSGQQADARTQAYNNALYGINQADLRNTGRSYGTQLAQQQAATQYGIQNQWVGLGGTIANANDAYSQVAAAEGANVGANAGQPSSGYYSSTTPAQKAGARYSVATSPTIKKSAGIYVPAYN